MRAVLFDAVGTLIQLREPVGKTYAHMARDFGVSVPAVQIQSAFEDVFPRMPPMAFPEQSAAGRARLERVWWQNLVQATFNAADRTIQFANFDQYFDRLFAHFATSTAWQVAPEAVSLLTALRARGLHTGIVSNFDHRLPALLDALDLSPLLDVVVLPADGGTAKPDPHIFALALERLGVPACQAVYVGDEVEDDIVGAQAAGLRAIDVKSLASLADVLQRID